SPDHRDLHSFPTRRSSDLVPLTGVVPDVLQTASVPVGGGVKGGGGGGLPSAGAAQAVAAAHVSANANLRRSNRRIPALGAALPRSEEHTSELQSLAYLVCR